MQFKISETAHPLVKYGIEQFNEIVSKLEGGKFTDDHEINQYYDIINYPHIFVLGCLMDRQIPAQKAWSIPYIVCSHFGCFDMAGLSKISLEEFAGFFTRKKVHRFNETMARIFYNGVQKIHTQYHDDAAEIWRGGLSCGEVVRRFKEFNGAGPKIATMAMNLLIRNFGIEFSDYSAVDISPDVHVCRIFYRQGLVNNEKNTNSVISKARELYPSFPGIMDYACWKLGQDICHPTNPECEKCPVTQFCEKRY